MKQRYAGILVAILLATTVCYSAVITGTVVNASKREKPVANQRVTLLGGTMSGAPSTPGTAVTNSDGEFRFENVAAEPGMLYRLETEFDDAIQRSGFFHVGSESITRRFLVHERSTTPEHINIDKIHLILAPDEQETSVAVTAVYVVRNSGGLFVGTQTEQGTTGLTFYVPDNANDFQIMQGALTAHHRITPEGFVTTIPFHPGSDTLVYGYTIPLQKKKAAWQIESAYPVTSLSVMAMAGSLELQVQNADEIPSPMGPQLINLERTDVAAGEKVEIIATTIGGTSSSAGRWLTIAAGIGLVVVIVFAIAIRRSTRTSRDVPQAYDGNIDTMSNIETSESENVADTLVGQIAELDLRYERGEIPEHDYVQQRREMKSQLVQALKDEER